MSRLLLLILFAVALVGGGLFFCPATPAAVAHLAGQSAAFVAEEMATGETGSPLAQVDSADESKYPGGDDASSSAAELPDDDEIGAQPENDPLSVAGASPVAGALDADGRPSQSHPRPMDRPPRA